MPRPTAELMRVARKTLFSHAVLWMPAFMIIMLQDMVFPLLALGGNSGQSLAGVLAAMGAVMLGAGWLGLIGRALRGGIPRLQDFADSINACWLPIVVGSLAFWLVIIGSAGATFWYGAQSYGEEPLLAWVKAIAAMTPEQQRAAMTPQALPPVVMSWINLGAAWMAFFICVNGLLLFWQPLVVLQGRGWFAAWADSLRLFGRRFAQIVPLGALHLAGLLSARLLMGGDNPLLVFFGVALYVGVVAFFMIVYALVVEDSFPSVVAPSVDTRA